MSAILGLEVLQPDYMQNLFNSSVTGSTEETESSFKDILNSAMQLIGETNTLANQADAKGIDFALGKVENTHEVATAQQKALLSLQYTVAVKNKLLEAYKEIMNIQI